MGQPQSTTPDFEIEEAETAADIDLEVDDDANLDVDVPSDDESDEVPATVEGETAKPTKAARPKAPEGYVKPVEFAKILSEHLGKTVPPQVVYSYIKNNSGESAKNPFPVHTLDGYEWYIKPEEGLGWWDAKNSRVAAGKQAKADKAAKAAAKATETPAATAEEPVVEAE